MSLIKSTVLFSLLFSLLLFIVIADSGSSGTSTVAIPPEMPLQVANTHLTLNGINPSDHAGSFVLSPYFYAGDYDYLGSQMMTEVNGQSQTLLSTMPASLQAITWAFAVGECGSETWSGVTAADFAKANVGTFVDAGKYYIVSTGGGGHPFLCNSNADFIRFIDTYYSANMIGVDFDIEASSTTQTDVNNLVAVIVAAQAQFPNLRYSFTVGSDGGNQAQSLGSFGKWVMAAIKTSGLKNYTINLLVMDYTVAGTDNPTICTMENSTSCDMGASALTAAQNLHSYYGVPYHQIELTPMIAENDNPNEIFSITDAITVSAFAVSNQLAGVHFWAYSRDKNSTGASSGATDTGNSAGFAGTLGYTNVFLTELGLQSANQ